MTFGIAAMPVSSCLEEQTYGRRLGLGGRRASVVSGRRKRRVDLVSGHEARDRDHPRGVVLGDRLRGRRLRRPETALRDLPALTCFVGGGLVGSRNGTKSFCLARRQALAVAESGRRRPSTGLRRVAGARQTGSSTRPKERIRSKDSSHGGWISLVDGCRHVRPSPPLFTAPLPPPTPFG